MGGWAGMEEALWRLVVLLRHGSANQTQGQVQWLWASVARTFRPNPLRELPAPVIQGSFQEASGFHSGALSLSSLYHSHKGSTCHSSAGKPHPCSYQWPASGSLCNGGLTPHSHPPAVSLPGILHVSMSQFPPLMWTPVMTTLELRLVHYGPHLMGFYIC